MAGSVADRPLPPQAVAFGEVGLAGELRPVSGMPRRLAEAARLGFRTAYVPRGVLGSGPVPPRMNVVEVPDVATAVVAALEAPRR